MQHRGKRGLHKGSIVFAAMLFSFFSFSVVFADIVDDDEAEFTDAGAVLTETQWDAGNSWVEMTAQGLLDQSATYRSRVIDLGTAQSWVSLLWETVRPTSKALPTLEQQEGDYDEGNVNMNGNVLYLSFDEDAGNLTDQSGNGFAALANGDPTYGGEGMILDSVTFDGNGDYFAVADNDAFSIDGLTGLSIAFWLYSPENLADGVTQGVISKGDVGAYEWSIDIEGQAAGDNWLTMTIVNNANELIRKERITLDPSTWQHVAFTIKGNQATTELFIYKNAVESSVLVSNDQGVAGYANAGGEFFLGKSVHGDFDGKLDELALFNFRLAANQVTDLYTRAALDVAFQVRSCNDALCDGEAFVGPNNDENAYYRESGTTTLSYPRFNLDIPGNRYFQYEVTFGTVSSTLSPYLQRVLVSSTPVAASSSLTSATQQTDGSGHIVIEADISHPIAVETKVKVEYKEDDGCNAVLGSAVGTVSEEYAATGVNTGDLTVDNADANGYAIQGIETAEEETITFAWDSLADIPNVEGEYCVFLTPNDGADGTISSTTVSIDNIQPTQPGAITVFSTSTDNAVFSLPVNATSTDTNFEAYEVWYKTGQGALTSTNTSKFTGDDDATLASSTFAGNETTTVSGLSPSTQYTANIYAKDASGNVTSSVADAVSFYTKPIAPSNLREGSKTAVQITMNWSANGNGDGTAYQITDGTNTSEWTEDTQYTFQGLQPSTEYTYQVKARNGEGVESALTAGVTVKTGGAGSPVVVSNPPLRISTGGGRSNKDKKEAEMPLISLYSLEKTTDQEAMIKVADPRLAPYIAISEDENFAGASFQKTEELNSFTLSEEPGEKVLYVRVRNEQGGTATVKFLVELLDSSVDAYIIDGAETDERNIAIQMVNTENMISVEISENSTFDGAVKQLPSDVFPFTLSEEPGDKLVYVRIQNKDNEFEVKKLPITLLKTVNTDPVSIAEGDKTKTPKITVKVKDPEAYESVVISEDPTFADAEKQTPEALIPFTLSETSGEKEVHVSLEDKEGQTETLTLDITLDAEEKEEEMREESVLDAYILDGNETDEQNIVIALKDPEQFISVELSEDPWFGDPNFEIRDIRTPAELLPFTLSPESGQKRVYIRVEDRFGIFRVDQLTIDLLEERNTDPVSIAQGDSTDDPNIIVKVKEPENYESIEISENADFSDAEKQTPEAVIPYTLSPERGDKEVYVRLEDTEGNTTEVKLPIALEALESEAKEKEKMPRIRIVEGSETNETNITLEVSDPSSLWSIEISEQSDFADAQKQKASEVMPFILSDEPGDKTVYVRKQDTKGNVEVQALPIRLLEERNVDPVSIAEGAETDDPNIIIKVKDPDAFETIEISEDPELADATPQAPAAVIPFELSPEVGEKEVHVRVTRGGGGSVRFVLPIRLVAPEAATQNRLSDTAAEQTRTEDVLTDIPFKTLSEDLTQINDTPQDSAFDFTANYNAEAVAQTLCASHGNRVYKEIESPGFFFLTEQCTRRLYATDEVYFTHYESWSDATLIPENVLRLITPDPRGNMTIGDLYPYDTGDMVKLRTNPKVYLLNNEQRHWIETEEDFEGYGFDWYEILDISEERLDDYEEGSVITLETSLPEGIS